MKNKVMGLILAVIILIVVPLIFADFQAGDPSHSISKQYSPGGNLTGWINISFDNELSSSVFETSRGDSASLMQLLNQNPGYDRDCFPADCSSDYSAVSGTSETEKTFSLNEDDEAIYGFKITEANFIGGVEDGSFSFNLTSDSAASYQPEIFVDVLNDGIIDWQPTAASGVFSSSKDYGCYTDSGAVPRIITSSKYCTKTTLSEMPNIKIGADVTGSNTATFTMEITSMQTGKSGECQFGNTDSEKECIPETSSGSNFAITEAGDFSICISSGNTGYQINSVPETGECVDGDDTDSYNFEVFARKGQYAAIGSVTIDDSEIEKVRGPGLSIEERMADYLNSKYGNDCSEGCTIPIKISSRSPQDVTIDQIGLSYTSGGAVTPLTGMYDVTEMPARVTSNYQKLYLDDAGFSVPGDIGDGTIGLTFTGEGGSESLFSEEIEIKTIPVVNSIDPKVVPAAYPQTFTAKVDSFGTNITRYKWDFYNDGTNVQTTSTNKAQFTYPELGSYTLKITIENDEGLNSSRTFNISVMSPENAVNSLLTKADTNIASIKSSIGNLSEFQQRAIKAALNFTEIETQISVLKQRQSTATSDQDFVDIMAVLSGLVSEIPLEVYEIGSGNNILFYPSENTVNIEALAEATGESYNSNREDDYVNAVLSWNLANTEPRVNYNKYSGVYENYEKEIADVFEVRINEQTGRENSYMMVKKLTGLQFRQSYAQEDAGGYYFINLGDEAKTIAFFTTEATNFDQLPVFISPSINQLSLADVGNIEEVNLFEQLVEYKWALFILVVLLLVGVAIGAYILIGKWYQKKYESHLFKNKNDLYNLINYINAAKKKEIDNKDIERSLRKSNWTSEQIKYVMKKYAGKRTGLPGIHEKIVKKKKSIQQGK